MPLVCATRQGFGSGTASCLFAHRTWLGVAERSRTRPLTLAVALLRYQAEPLAAPLADSEDVLNVAQAKARHNPAPATSTHHVTRRSPPTTRHPLLATHS
jgi:hypothetical protein